MKPIEKTSEDLFQKLRSRFSPITMGDEDANETSNPGEARIFNFMYKENGNDVSNVSISIIDYRSFKVYYGTDLVEKIENKSNWFKFLKDLRMFAKRNLMSFDARDLAKNQLEPRDFKFISQQDKTYKENEVTVSESVMFGSRRKSYQTMENVKMIVNHRKSIDETIPGSRSRYIESIYLERADGERYKFPYNYLTGARAMARHVNEGGNPYDDMGKHIVSMIKEMRDLSKFARRTKKHAMEDENAGSIRNSVVERFHNMKKQLGAMSVKEGYTRFVENFKAEEALVEDDTIQQIKERFTQQVFDTQLEDTLPAVIKAIKESEMNQLAEKTVEKKPLSMVVKTSPLVLRKDDAADDMFRNTKFTDGIGLLGFILSDIASRVIGDNADEIANFASDAAERVQDKDYDQNDKQVAMTLAKKYMDDVKKIISNPGYKDEVRMDPKNVYGKMKKRKGGFHESEAYEAWANELVPEDYEKDAADWSKKYADNEKHARNQAKSTVPLVARISPEWKKEHTKDADRMGAISKKYAHKAVTGMEEDYDPNSKEATNYANAEIKRFGNLKKNASSQGDKIKFGKEAASHKRNAVELNRKAVTGMEEDRVDELSPNLAKRAASAAKIKGYDYQHKAQRLDNKNDTSNDGGAAIGYAKKANDYDSLSNKKFDQAKKFSSYARKKSPPGGPSSKKKVGEAGTQGTVGTQAPANPGVAMRDPKLQQAAKNVSRVAQAAGIKAPANQVAQGMAAQATGKVPPRNSGMTTMGLGSTIEKIAASDPAKANQLAGMMKKMVTAGKFDEAAVKRVLEAPAGFPEVNRAGKTDFQTPPPIVNRAGKGNLERAIKTAGGTPQQSINAVQPPPQVNRAAKVDLPQTPFPTVNRVGKGDMEQYVDRTGKGDMEQYVNRTAKVDLPKGPTQITIPGGDLPVTPAAVPPTPTAKPNMYQINKGDNLSTLAKNWNVSVADIMKANQGITNPNKIYAGQKLVRPGATGNPIYQGGIGTKAGPQNSQNMRLK